MVDNTTTYLIGGVHLENITKDGSDSGSCLVEPHQGVPDVDIDEPEHCGHRCMVGSDAAAPCARSLRSTERYSIDRAIHSLVCCSTRKAQRLDALLPRVRSLIWPITALSQDNLGGKRGDRRLLEKTAEIHYCYCYCLHYLLVRKNGWKLLAVGNVQLSQDVLRPTRHPLVTRCP